MNIDLDAMTEEQDPPSFKAARKKDKVRIGDTLCCLLVSKTSLSRSHL